MTLLDLKQHLTSLIGHVTFGYNGCSCGIDPLAADEFDMWYGDNDIVCDSIESVMENELFDGKTLKDIWDEIADLDY